MEESECSVCDGHVLDNLQSANSHWTQKQTDIVLLSEEIRERERERQVRVECEVLLSVSNNGIIANTQTHTIMYASTHTVCVFVCTYMHACVVGQIK